jgi:DNA polymerase-3 subunit gamma/tau
MLVTEIDAASNTSVDNVRQVIVNSSTFSPPANQHRVFIIDEVHQLSGPAFNALLKTIEEPPPRVLFIMATTELQKVPDTIISRCQVFEFRTIPLPKVIAELNRIATQLGITISESALGTIARAGEGSMRDAESAFDQVISFAGANVSDEDVSLALGLPGFETLRAVLEAVADQDPNAILRIVDLIVTRGYDIRNFCREVMTYVRNLLVVKVSGFDQELTQMPGSEAQWITGLADRFSDQDLIRFFSILSKTEQDIRLSSQPRFQLEIGLVKMAQCARLYLLEEAIDRMTAIQAALQQDISGARPALGEPPSSRRLVNERSPAPMTRPIVPPSTIPKGIRPAGPSPNPSAQKPPRDSEPATRPLPQPGPAPGPPAASTVTSETPPSPALPNEAENGHHLNKPADPVTASSAQTPGTSAREDNDDPAAAIEKVKKVLEGRKRMMLLIALERAQQVSIEGSYLILIYAPSNSHEKTEVENARQLIEESCYEALGTRLTLSASIAGSPGPPRQTPSSVPSRPSTDAADETPENDPAVRAVLKRFDGEIISVEMPEQ